MTVSTAPYIVKTQPVDSSNIAEIGYDPDKLVLAVLFKSGDLWHYAGVPLDIAAKLAGAESKGKFYGAHVRSKFTAAKMTGPCPKCGDKGRIGTRCMDCGTADYEDARREDVTPA